MEDDEDKQLVHWKLGKHLMERLRRLAVKENRSIVAQAEYLLNKALVDD